MKVKIIYLHQTLIPLHNMKPQNDYKTIYYIR